MILAGPAAALAQTEPADSVQITFDWPVGMRAEVQLSRLFSQETPAGADTVGVLVSYFLTVNEHENGLLIALDDFRLVRAVPPLRDPASVQTLAGTLLPSFTLDGRSHVRQVTEVDRLRSAVQGQVVRALQRTAVPRELPPLVARLTHADDLQAVVQDLWAALVEAWNGATLQVGAVYETEGRELSRVDPGVEVPVRYRFGAVERTPCHPEDPDDDCVELRLISTPRAPLTQLSDAWAAELFPNERGLTVESVETEDRVTMIAEAEGLFPHRVEIIRDVRGEAAQGGGRFPFHRRHVRSIEIIYLARP